MSTSTIALVGRGVVGTRIAARIPLVTDARVIDVDPRSQLRLAPAQLAVLAGPRPHAPVAARLLESGVGVVSVADDLEDVRALLDLDDLARHADVPLVVSAGMSPGLSGLLARQLADGLTAVDEIHVAVHGTAGPACALQHHRALAGRAVGWHDGRWIERSAGAGRELCWFPEPVGAYDCYRAELADPVLLREAFPEAVRISARVSANRRDRLTARIPMRTPPHPEGGVGALRVEVRGVDADGGRSTKVVGVAELVGTTAAATATAFVGAAVAGALPSGVVTPSDVRLDAPGLLSSVQRLGVRLQEFTGIPTPELVGGTSSSGRPGG